MALRLSRFGRVYRYPDSEAATTEVVLRQLREKYGHEQYRRGVGDYYWAFDPLNSIVPKVIQYRGACFGSAGRVHYELEPGTKSGLLQPLQIPSSFDQECGIALRTFLIGRNRYVSDGTTIIIDQLLANHQKALDNISYLRAAKNAYEVKRNQELRDRDNEKSPFNK